jgi:hypothetical protein
MTKYIHAIAAAIFFGAAATPTLASPTFYTDEAAFRAASPALTMESFENPMNQSQYAAYFQAIDASADWIFDVTSQFGATDGITSVLINSGTLTFAHYSPPDYFTAFGVDIVKEWAHDGYLSIDSDHGSAQFRIDGTDQQTATKFFFGVIDPAGFANISFHPTEVGDVLLFDRAQFATLSVQGAVPEPASWTMLIAGFGLVGAAMRRRAAPPVVSA